MQKVARGDQQAFRALYEAHKHRVWGLCVRMLGAGKGAEDMAQESWMRIIKNASQYRPVGQLSAWICQVTRNVCLNELRGQKWEESFEDVESELPGTDDPAAVFEQMSERKELEKAFAELAPQQRAVFVLFVFEEMSHAEIAKELSLSVNAVKQLIFRAKERLRREPR